MGRPKRSAYERLKFVHDAKIGATSGEKKNVAQFKRDADKVAAGVKKLMVSDEWEYLLASTEQRINDILDGHVSDCHPAKHDAAIVLGTIRGLRSSITGIEGYLRIPEEIRRHDQAAVVHKEEVENIKKRNREAGFGNPGK